MRTSPGSRLAPDERRGHLIREGVELLGRRDYNQLSIIEIARAAGISKGLLYHYFPTKSDFVVAVLRQAREQLEERMAVTDIALGPDERVDASLDAFLSYAEEHAGGFQAIARARSGDDDAIRAELAEGRRRRIDQLTNFAAAYAGRDRPEVESPALEIALAGWLANSEEVVVRWLSGGALSRDEVRHMLKRTLLAAVDSALGLLLGDHPERAAHERVDPAEVGVGAG